MNNSIAISVCSIATQQDLAFLEKLKTPLPDYCERVIMLNRRADTETFVMQTNENNDDNTRIYRYEYTGELDFAMLRNKCKTLARGAWILWQDTDDMLCISLDEYEEIRSLSEDVFGVDLPVLIFNCVTGLPHISHQIKLHRNHPDIMFDYAVHETVRECLQRANLKVIKKNYTIKHFGYDDPQRLRDHLIRNRDILIKELAKQKIPSDYLLNHLRNTMLGIAE